MRLTHLCLRICLQTSPIGSGRPTPDTPRPGCSLTRGLLLLQSGSCNGADHLSQVRVGVRRVTAHGREAREDGKKMKELNRSVLLLRVALSSRKADRQLSK